ncbi:adenylyltransferase/cytidyltransferase family protein [Pseudonocardia nigra]|uniref:adenylyltransferase/cytidyltransferase family protein n=1 Tax=Pseudonocardia nigra TaxID=1921578 RepID=UPI001C5F13F0|nr:adenylyltransferase/cytidyltransferase family protein [Pseudonocardia nigra]
MTAPALSRATPVWHGVEQVPLGWGPCVVTLGVFDGLHRGHARLVQRAVRTGRARGLPVVLVTFDPHPARVVGLPRDTAQLTTVERRAELAGDLGVDAVCVLRFTPEFARLGPAEFVEQVLVGALRAAAVVVGANFTFGHRGAGDPALLRALGERHGFTAEAVALLHAVAVPCSSTAVRTLLRAGDVHGAARVLGRPHRVDGVADGGELVVAEGTAVPAPGHYAVRLACGRHTDLEVTADGRLLVDASGVEFLDRLEGA